MSEEKKEKIVEAKKIEIVLPSAEELIEAGVHFGHQTSRWNPKMKGYIFSTKNAVHLIDVQKTLAKLKEAADFIVRLAQTGGIVIFVGIKPTVKKIMKEGAQACGMPFVVSRWLGGTLTNFKTISKRLEHFRDLESKMVAGELKKYTKKEQLMFKRELENLEINFGGIKHLAKPPEAIFVTDLKESELAVREAKKTGVKVVAICDTNTDPTLADYPIPGNDDAVSSVKIIIDTIVKAINKTKE